MSWGNAANATYPQDMDSSGHKLNVNGTVSGANWQAEVSNTNTDGQALKVKGKIRLDRAGQTCGFIEPATGTPTGSLSLQDSAGTECIKLAGGITSIGTGPLIQVDPADGNQVKIGGSTPRVLSEFFQVDNALLVNGAVGTPNVDSQNSGVPDWRHSPLLH